ncbi:MAG: 4Fe-4S binding protein, partial [Proteobacteria bacterium]|nr:4Fe-4S binding protein [Pseudomonadota bacterium]
RLNSYGNFDRSGEESFINLLSPGVEDLASKKVYHFDEIEKRPLIIIVGIIFPLFLILLLIRNIELRLGIKRWLVQWITFIITRLGVLRVSGFCPVQRTSFGTFPFLNCQACEMATGACPIGSMQAFLCNLKFPFFILGSLLIVGLALGRWICGWLCPFGLLSDLLDKISFKIRLPRVFSIGKYIVLALIPILSLAFVGQDHLPFCTYLCHSGLVYGLLPYYLTTAKPAFSQGLSHPILLYHIILGIAFLLFILLFSGRFFCRVLCPLGGFLGLFNKISLVKVVHSKKNCNDCKKCVSLCPMGVDLRKDNFLDWTNCIMCSRCIKLCPQGARRWSFEKCNSLAK